jgi:hypothetical protein
LRKQDLQYPLKYIEDVWQLPAFPLYAITALVAVFSNPSGTAAEYPHIRANGFVALGHTLQTKSRNLKNE